jgi:hypothetical protein
VPATPTEGGGALQTSIKLGSNKVGLCLCCCEQQEDRGNCPPFGVKVSMLAASACLGIWACESQAAGALNTGRPVPGLENGKFCICNRAATTQPQQQQQQQQRRIHGQRQQEVSAVFLRLSSLFAQGVSGFLTVKDYATYYGASSPPLLPGTLLDVAVKEAPVPRPDGTMVQVSSYVYVCVWRQGGGGGWKSPAGKGGGVCVRRGGGVEGLFLESLESMASLQCSQGGTSAQDLTGPSCR